MYGIELLGALIGYLLFFGFFLFLYAWICSWVYIDSRKNGKSHGYALTVFLLAFFLPVVGHILYIVIRKI